MCDFSSARLSSGRSSDRLEVLVWALTRFMLAGGAGAVAGRRDVAGIPRSLASQGTNREER